MYDKKYEKLEASGKELSKLNAKLMIQNSILREACRKSKNIFSCVDGMYQQDDDSIRQGIEITKQALAAADKPKGK